MSTKVIEGHVRRLGRARLMRVTGRVVDVTGLTVVAEGLPVPIGSLVEIRPKSQAMVRAQVVGLRGTQTLLMPFGAALGLATGDVVESAASLGHLGVGPRLLGRVLDGFGEPMDELGPIAIEEHYPVYAEPPASLSRGAIEAPLACGIRAIDGMLTLGRGQRIGLFAGTGVGKSVLMGMIARNTSADVLVAALVGERGREVGDFLRRELDVPTRARTVTVVSTSDQSPVLRVRAGFTATAVAEYFRDQGRQVLLLVDSVTRMAMAQRQIGLAAGEPPTTKGYPPSVFGLLPPLLERAGCTASGSITGLYTVLVEGDDFNEPISDAVRGILDGHVWLSRSLANRGHYPAVSVLESVSRLMKDVASTEQLAAASAVRRVMATWAEIEDLVNIGAYAKGTQLEFDVAIDMQPEIGSFLRQGVRESASFEDTVGRLVGLHERIKALEARPRAGTPGPDAKSRR